MIGCFYTRCNNNYEQKGGIIDDFKANLSLTWKSLEIFVGAPHQSSTPVEYHIRHKGLEIELLLTTFVSAIEGIINYINEILKLLMNIDENERSRRNSKEF